MTDEPPEDDPSRRIVPPSAGERELASANRARDEDPALSEARQYHDLAGTEARQFGRKLTVEQFKEIAEREEHKRTENFRNHFECLAVFALWAFAGVLGILLLIWLAHLVLPIECHWLSREQLSTVQTLLTGGIVVGVVTGHLKKRLPH